MAPGSKTARVRVENLNNVLRAFDRLPGEANRILKERTQELARRLAAQVKAAAAGDSRQSRRAASTVRPAGGNTPSVTAGPHPLLFGSEFGATRKFGWYSKGRYWSSPAKQFRPHRGGNSYWFFRTVEDRNEEIQQEWRDTADAIVRSWDA